MEVYGHQTVHFHSSFAIWQVITEADKPESCCMREKAMILIIECHRIRYRQCGQPPGTGVQSIWPCRNPPLDCLSLVSRASGVPLTPEVVVVYGQYHSTNASFDSNSGCSNFATMPLVRKMLSVVPFRSYLVASCTLITVGSIVSGAAKSIYAVIAGRAVTGVGSAAIYQVGLSWLTTFGRPVEVTRGNSLVGMGYALGVLIGPIIGGAFAQNIHATWRWAIYLNLPFMAVIFCVAVFLPAYHVPSRLSILQRLVQMDWIGLVLHAASVVTICVALTLSGSVWSWNSGSAIAMWVVTGSLWAAYLVQQSFCLFTTRQHQALPVVLLRHRTVGLLFACVSLLTAAHGVALYYSPVFQAFAKGYDSLEAAVRIMPYLGINIFASILSGVVLPRFGRYNILFITSGVLILIGGVLLAHNVSRTTSESHILGFQAILGFGVGLSFPHGLSVANRILPREQRFDATLIFQMAQAGSTALFSAVAGCVFENDGFKSLQRAVAAYEATSGTPLNYTTHDIREALAGVDSPLWKESNLAFEVLAVDAVAKVITRLFYIAVAGGSLCLIGALLMKWEKLDFHAPLDAETSEGESAQVRSDSDA